MGTRRTLAADAVSHADTYAVLRWRSRRGLLELDVLLTGFLERNYHAMSARERSAFARLLEHGDAELLEWLLGRAMSERPELRDLVQRIRACAMP